MSKSLRQAFWLIGVFFALLFVAIGYTLHLAFSGFEPSMDEAYYRKGMDYQVHIDRFRRGETAGWRLEGGIPSTGVTVGNRPVRFRLTAPKPIGETVRLQLRLERRASTRDRQQIVVPGEVRGNDVAFSGSLRVPGPGSWELFADAGTATTAVFRRMPFEVTH